MSKPANKPNDLTNSEEEKSDEFKNFERGIEHALSLPKEEVERIKKEIPAPKQNGRKNESH